MGLFNLLETFFFVSLGITFVLILLLVYHFKQRISTIEKKSDTMFEIINNIVQELTVLKSHQISLHNYQSHPVMNRMPFTNISQNNGENIMMSSEAADDESSDDESTDSDTDADDSSVDSEDDNEDDNNEAIHPIETTELEEDNTIKIINVEHLDKLEMEELPDEPVLEQESDTDSPAELIEQETILVEKLETNGEEEEHLEESSVVSGEGSNNNSKEVYRKMNLGALKTLVITKGLCTDPSRMKKPELLKLLETNNE